MTTEIVLQIGEEGSDELRLDELARQLREELLHTEAESVTPLPAAEAPDGARGIGVVAGALVAAVSETNLAGIVTAVLGWVRRAGRGREVCIRIDGDEIVVKGASTDTERMLVTSFIERHSAAPAT